MRRIGNWIKALIFLSFFPSVVFAGVTVELTSSSKAVGLGEQVEVRVRVQSKEPLGEVEFFPVVFSGFEVLAEKTPAPRISRSLVVTPSGHEFQASYSQEKIFLIQPKKMGSYRLGPAEVLVRGERLASSTLNLQVDEASRESHPDDEEDLFGQMQDMEDQLMKQLLLQRRNMLGGRGGRPSAPGSGRVDQPPGLLNPKFRSLPKNSKEAFFVQVEVDKTQVYEGEQITVNWFLYSRGQMETLDRLKFPTLKGFWKEIIEEAPQLQFFEEIVNGVSYRKALLASHALFPIKAGSAVIDEFKIKSRVRLPVSGLGGIYGNAYEYTKSAPPVTIQVKPLPKEGRPNFFTGAVGEFNVTLKKDPEPVLLGQPFPVRLRVEGRGNAKTIELPPLNLPPALEVYETKSEAKYFKDGRSFKEFQILLIPKMEGEVEIPPMSFAYFDPEKAQYRIQSTEVLKIQVQPNASLAAQGSKQNEGSVGPSSGGEPKGEKDQTLGLRLSWDKPFFSSFEQVFQFWGVLYVFIFLGLLGYLSSVRGWFHHRENAKVALIKRLSHAESRKLTNDQRRMATEFVNLFYQSLALASDTGVESNDIEGLMARTSPNLQREFGDRIRKNFAIFQALSFAPEEAIVKLKEPNLLRENRKEAGILLRAILQSAPEKSNENIED